MEIYLMQHGLAVPETQDSERPLSTKGIEQIKISAKAMSIMGLRFDAIVASTKKRSRQTAVIIAEIIGFPKDAVNESETLCPSADPELAIEYLDRFAELDSFLIAGHLPILQHMASRILCASANVMIQFENGGLCRIDVDSFPTQCGVLRWNLSWDHLRQMSR